MNLFSLIFFSVSCLLSHFQIIKSGASFFRIENRATPQFHRPLERFATLGFYESGADKAWIQFINYFGDRKKHNEGYPNLFFYLERVQAIDPFFIQVYHRMGLLSSLAKPTDVGAILNHLEEGQHRQPHDWLVPFLRASLLMQNEDGLAEAASAMRAAASRPDAPAYLGLLSVRLATAGGSLDAASAVVAQLEREAPDEATRGLLLERKLQILYEAQLRQLDQGLADYLAHNPGVNRPTLPVIFAHDKSLPQTDPWGADYSLSAGPSITSANLGKRLVVVRP